MSINVYESISESEFNIRLQKLLAQLEGVKNSPYADTANPSHPTIGIGFDLTVSTVRNKVYAAMGVVVGSDTEIALTRAIYASLGKTTAEVQAKLNAAYGGNFVMTDSQISSTFKEIAKPYVQTALSSGVSYSNELVALTSLAFNGLYGGQLSAALSLQDPNEARAEAWYQIRYVHKPQLYKRRYVEAALFGLYDNPSGTSGTAESLAIYRMYTKHAKESLASDPNGMASYDSTNSSSISAANAELTAAGFSSSAKSLENELKLAAVALENHYVVERGLGIPNGFSPWIFGFHLRMVEH